MIAEMNSQYATHLPQLLACMAVTTGPVIELGCGWFSTPIAHAVCTAQHRLLITVEASPEWASKFQHYEGAYHTFFVIDYDAALEEIAKTFLTDRRAGCVLVDESPGGERRRKSFEWALAHADYVVMHDAQRGAENFAAVKHLLYSSDALNWKLCQEFFPHTLIASATRELPEGLL